MNYIAYTIGPIYETIFDTLNSENKTKRLKAGSYYFSLFMKTLLANIKDEFEILVPYVNENVLSKEYGQMGLFHDRFVAQTIKTKTEIKDIFEQKLEETFIWLAKNIKDESITAELQENMSNHLIIASDSELKTVDANIIFALNKILDSKELHRRFSLNMPKINWIHRYQDNQIIKSKVKTIEDMSEKLGFKYYVVITADGDRIGAKIQKEATENPSKIKELSRKLYEFFTEDEDVYSLTHNEFGGELIYAGGDDILAFVPVKYKENTFLDYIQALDERFKEKVGADVSLSFGVNIAYYKYPLRDAIKSSFDLLYEAKSDVVTKNRLSIKVTKHSGQWFSSTFAIQSSQYTEYKSMLIKVLEKEISLPHSIHHSLGRYKEAILATYKQEHGSTKALFATIFNDSRATKEQAALKDLQGYLDIFRPQNHSEFNELFSQLSMIKFLRGDRK